MAFRKFDELHGALVLRALGDVLGSLLYLGHCHRCKQQFMSRHDRVAVVDDQRICARCARSYSAQLCDVG